MSIFIKTMTNLPEHCYECPCHNEESGRCQADKEHGVSFDRPSWCPLVKIENKPKKPNCHFCDHYKDEYCDLLDIKPYCPEKGCDFFKPCMDNFQEIYEKVKDLSERVEALEKQIEENKKEEIEKLKAELNYAKYRCALPTIFGKMRDENDKRKKELENRFNASVQHVIDQEGTVK